MFVPEPNVNFHLDGMRLVMVMVLTIGNLYVAGVALSLVWHRNYPIVRSSFKFSLVSCLGAVLCFTGVYVSYPVPTDSTCALEPWVADLSFVTLFGPLFVETYRIDKLFNNKMLKKCVIKDGQVLQSFAVMLLVFVVFRLIWTIVSLARCKKTWTLDGYRFERCVSRIEGFQYMAYAMKTLVLLWGRFLCERVFKIAGNFSRFNASKQLVLGIYNTSFLAMVLLLLMVTVKDPNVYFAVFCGLLMVNTFFTVTVLFVFPILTGRLEKSTKRSDQTSDLSSPSTDATAEMHAASIIYSCKSY